MLRRSLLKALGLSGIAAMVESTQLRADTPLPETLVTGINQAGYLPHARKLATVQASAKATPGADFQLLSVAGEVVYRGTLSTPTQDQTSGDLIAIADFSAFTTPGIYSLYAGGQRTALFPIATDVYRDPLRLTVRSYYGQRCGCAVDLGQGYRHDACHASNAYHPSSGKEGILSNHGGWHDAGDYGRYVVNSGITTATLLYAWELYSEPLRKLRLQIPESNGKLPDYLAEIRWNLDWMLSMQDADGGVWHKQTSQAFCNFIMPDRDTLTSYTIGTASDPYKSTCATADLAAVAAIAARIYSEFDTTFAQRCLTAAKAAYAWAIAHPAVTFTNPNGITTGDYGDPTCTDELLWASAELGRTTGDAHYERAFLDSATASMTQMKSWVPSWSDVAPLAFWTWMMAGRKSSDAKRANPLKAAIRQSTIEAAETLTQRATTSGYGHTLEADDYKWGSNSVAANQSLLLLIADKLQPNPRFLEAAIANLHYLLGRNCFGVSWVTQVGANPFQNPHHRPSGADSIKAPWPGLLSGGPNAHPSDEASKGMPKQAPMRMWLDDQAAYSLNEVAINWNAPLVFLLAAANDSVS